jgi:hypothetical protein
VSLQFWLESHAARGEAALRRIPTRVRSFMDGRSGERSRDPLNGSVKHGERRSAGCARFELQCASLPDQFDPPRSLVYRPATTAATDSTARSDRTHRCTGSERSYGASTRLVRRLLPSRGPCARRRRLHAPPGMQMWPAVRIGRIGASPG